MVLNFKQVPLRTLLIRRLADAGPRFKSWVIDSDGLGSNALDRVLENRRVPR